MAITNGYIELVELQSYLDSTGQAKWNAAQSLNQERSIESASRWIDEYTGTRFYTSSGDETRYYETTDRTFLWLQDDLKTVTTIKIDDDDDGVYEVTLAASDYYLRPTNATLNGEPYRFIEMSDESNYSWPVGVQDGVEIVGTFGFSTGLSTVPPQVAQACLIIAHHFYKLSSRSSGAGGAAAVGTTSAADTVPNSAKVLLDSMPRRGGFF